MEDVWGHLWLSTKRTVIQDAYRPPGLGVKNTPNTKVLWEYKCNL